MELFRDKYSILIVALTFKGSLLSVLQGYLDFVFIASKIQGSTKHKLSPKFGQLPDPESPARFATLRDGMCNQDFAMEGTEPKSKILS